MLQDDSSRGFTLLEVAVVVTLLAVTAAWSASVGPTLLENYRLKLATSNLVAHLRSARQTAIVRGRSVSIAPGAKGRAYLRVTGDGKLEAVGLPSGVSISGRKIGFHPRGNASPAGSLTLAGARASTRVVISVSGRVRWEVNR